MHTVPAHSTPEKLIRLPEVLRLTGAKQSWTYLLIKKGDFPAPVRLGARAVAWRESEVLAWIASRPTARPTTGGAA